MNFIVDFNEMLLFFLSSNLSLPYKLKSMNLLSLGKEMSISLRLFVRADLFAYRTTTYVMPLYFNFNSRKTKKT